MNIMFCGWIRVVCTPIEHFDRMLRFYVYTKSLDFNRNFRLFLPSSNLLVFGVFLPAYSSGFLFLRASNITIRYIIRFRLKTLLFDSSSFSRHFASRSRPIRALLRWQTTPNPCISRRKALFSTIPSRCRRNAVGRKTHVQTRSKSFKKRTIAVEHRKIKSVVFSRFRMCFQSSVFFLSTKIPRPFQVSYNIISYTPAFDGAVLRIASTE